jgi:hypothetical protein
VCRDARPKTPKAAALRAESGFATPPARIPTVASHDGARGAAPRLCCFTRSWWTRARWTAARLWRRLPLNARAPQQKTSREADRSTCQRRAGRRRAGARDAHGARSGHACWQPRVVKYHDFDRVPRVGVLRHKRYRNELVDFDQHILLLILIAPNLLSMPPPLSIGVCALLPVPREHMSKTLSE